MMALFTMQSGSHIICKKNNGGIMYRRIYFKDGVTYETPRHRYIKNIRVCHYDPGDWCGSYIDKDGRERSRYSQPRYRCYVTYNCGTVKWEFLETRFMKKYIKNT